MSIGLPCTDVDVGLDVATPRPVARRIEFSVNWSMIWRGDGGTLELKGDMARRLAVCWNVLEGIPTDALERGILRDVFQAVAAGDLPAAQRAVEAIGLALRERGEAGGETRR